MQYALRNNIANPVSGEEIHQQEVLKTSAWFTWVHMKTTSQMIFARRAADLLHRGDGYMLEAGILIEVLASPENL
jgi:hypothetical protein